MTPVQTVPPVEAPPPTCPLCHTPSPLSSDALQAGGYWACPRCGQTWTGERLETFAAYARLSDSFNRSVPVGPQEAETIH
jgi:ribosomal protein L37AE/L43A